MPAADAVLPEHLTGPAKDAVLAADLAPQPSALQRLGQNVANAITPGASGASLGKQELMPRPDPAGKGTPTPWYVNVPEDVVGGLAQIGGAAGGAAVGGPLGAIAGAGAGAAADDILNAKINHQLYGHAYQPTLGGILGTAAIGAATEGIPMGGRALQEGMVARSLTKAGTEAADTAEAKLYKEELPAAKAKYETAIPAAKEAEQTDAAKAVAQQQAAVEKAQAIKAKAHETATADIEKARIKAATDAERAEAAKAKARGEVAKDTVPKAAQMELENFVGRTPAERDAVRNAPEKFFARRRAAMASSTVWDPMNKMSDELGKQYDLAAPPEVLRRPVGHVDDEFGGLKPIQDAIANERQELAGKGFGRLDPKVEKLANVFEQGSDSDWGAVAKVSGTKEADRLLRGDPAALEERANLARRIIEDDRARAKADPKYKPIFSPEKVLSNGDLLAMGRNAGSLVGKLDGPSNVAAARIREAIYDKLEANGIKIPPDLNLQYKTYKDVFNPAFRREVGTAIHPEDYAHKIFLEPRRFNSLWARAEPGDKVALRNLFGDYAISLGPEGLGKQIEKGAVDRSMLRTMFGNSAYSRIEPWLTSDAKAMGWEQLMARGNPAIRDEAQRNAASVIAPMNQTAEESQAQFAAAVKRAEESRMTANDVAAQAAKAAKESMEAEVKAAATKGAAAIAGAGRDMARSLGPAGNGILTQLKGDPIQAARATQQIFGKILGDVPSPMPSAGSPGMAAYRQSKAIAQGLDIKAKRQEAAVAQIVKLAQQGDPITKNLMRKLQFYGPLMVALSATGTVSPYLMAAGGYSLLGGLLFQPRKAMLRALTDETAATLFYKGIETRPSVLNARTYGRKMGEFAARLFVKSSAQAAAKGMGLSADIPPEGEGE